MITLTILKAVAWFDCHFSWIPLGVGDYAFPLHALLFLSQNQSDEPMFHPELQASSRTSFCMGLLETVSLEMSSYVLIRSSKFWASYAHIFIDHGMQCPRTDVQCLLCVWFAVEQCHSSSFYGLCQLVLEWWPLKSPDLNLNWMLILPCLNSIGTFFFYYGTWRDIITYCCHYVFMEFFLRSCLSYTDTWLLNLLFFFFRFFSDFQLLTHFNISSFCMVKK